jgi:hypothetical protein
MKSSNITPIHPVAAGLGLALLLSLAGGAAMAEDEAPEFMLSVLSMDIKPGHVNDMMDGIAAWRDCYLEHGGESRWTVWRRMHGDGANIVVSFVMNSWADLDDQDEAGEACQEIARERINPYSHRSDRSFLRFLPEYSRSQEDPGNVIRVTSFQVKDMRKFRSHIETAIAAQRAAEGDSRGYWYGVIGGPADRANMIVVNAFDNFAGLDEARERDTLYDLIKNHQGEQAAEDWRQGYMDSVTANWSYLYRRDADRSR